MRHYGESPDNQTQLEIPGVNDKAREIWDQVREWKLTHFSEWCFYKSNAQRECEGSSDGKTSPNTCLSDMRRKFKCEIPNAWAPALARMAMAEDDRIKFRMAKSMFDACADIKL